MLTSFACRKPVEGYLTNVIYLQENTHHRGKYNCTNDFLFDWFGFNQPSKFVANSTKAKELNPNIINRRSDVQ